MCKGDGRERGFWAERSGRVHQKFGGKVRGVVCGKMEAGGNCLGTEPVQLL